MNAEQAKAIAVKKMLEREDIQHLLIKIQDAAKNGKLEVIVDAKLVLDQDIPPFLDSLGYQTHWPDNHHVIIEWRWP